MKICSGCNTDKSDDLYKPNRNKCKECEIEYRKKWYSFNKDYYKTNKIKEYSKLTHKKWREGKKCNSIYFYKFNNQLLYIGSTNLPEMRHHHHRSNTNNPKGKKYSFHKYLNDNNINFDDLDYTLLRYPDETDVVIKQMEKLLIKNLQPLTNVYSK